jgi:hypothetical protein
MRHSLFPMTLRMIAAMAFFGRVVTLPASTPEPAPAISPAAAHFEKEILPILEDHCFDCHGDGEKKGKVAFDGFSSTTELAGQKNLWMAVLKNVRAGLMPPEKEPRIPQDRVRVLEDWIKKGAFGLDPANPDPGRVTLRRLNRVEYRNTIRDLMGIDFRADAEFPADDTGYGFDNIGDVLSTSPLLLEKYMAAAETIVVQAVPLVSRTLPERRFAMREFKGAPDRDGEWNMSLYDAADLPRTLRIEKAGTYRLKVLATLFGSFDFDPARANVIFIVDGKERWRRELKWKDREDLKIAVEEKFEPGEYEVRFVVQPLVGREKKPAPRPGEGDTYTNVDFGGLVLAGPLEREHWIMAPGYDRFFTRAEPPSDRGEWAQAASETLRRFTMRAFRRPVDEGTVAKLAAITQRVWESPDASFEQGVARAMTAVLASPRFLFRVEEAQPGASPGAHPFIDEYALASRLSYFLWSTMPDAELMDLAARGELRKNLGAQVRRMLGDGRINELVENFAGQWLQTRDVESVSIDARVVQARDAGTEREGRQRSERFRQINEAIDEATRAGDEALAAELRKQLGELRAQFRGQRRVEFSRELRTAMLREAEMLFRHLLREDRSAVDLLDADYTFLNETLAGHYGIPGVQGREMRLVKLPADSPRGGVLTMGATLAVTSNPNRTSPVKRGIFVLDNILGTPTPPAPPDVPALEASEKTADGKELSLRDALALHREQPLCSSCHNRMDPLGLAFENFNAMGMWRDKERGEPIPSVAGKLITGEKFADVRELKRLLANERRNDFYHCLAEKMLTYALGRGPEPCDVLALDTIVERMHREDGRLSALILGVIESAPFQKRRAEL